MQLHMCCLQLLFDPVDEMLYSQAVLDGGTYIQHESSALSKSKYLDFQHACIISGGLPAVATPACYVC